MLPHKVVKKAYKKLDEIMTPDFEKPDPPMALSWVLSSDTRLMPYLKHWRLVTFAVHCETALNKISPQTPRIVEYVLAAFMQELNLTTANEIINLCKLLDRHLPSAASRPSRPLAPQ